MNFPAKLSSLMRHSGLTQAGLGQSLGVSQKAVSKWQNGESRPGAETAIRLAALFHVPIEVLLDDTKPLAFEEYLAGLRADVAKVQRAYPDNTAAAQHGLDYLQQSRLVKREVQKLRQTIGELAEIASTLDPTDDQLRRIAIDLKSPAPPSAQSQSQKQ